MVTGQLLLIHHKYCGISLVWTTEMAKEGNNFLPQKKKIVIDYVSFCVKNILFDIKQKGGDSNDKIKSRNKFYL